MFGCMFRMLGCVNSVGVRYLGVMGGRVVVARLVMLSRFRMMMRSHAVMMGCLFVMILPPVLTCNAPLVCRLMLPPANSLDIIDARLCGVGYGGFN